MKDKIIDTHVHLPWQDEFSTIEEKKIELKKQMKNNGIDYAIIIADSEIHTNIGNNEEVVDAIKDDPSLFCIFGYSPLERHQELLEQAEIYLKKDLIKGIKLYPGHENFSMNDIRLEPVFNLCMKYDVPLAIHTEWNHDYFPQYSHPMFICEIAKRYPKLQIVCCHTWMPKVMFCFDMVKDIPNINIDISAFMMGEEMIKKYSGFPNLDQATQTLKSVFEYCSDRIMYGSDYGSLSIKDHIQLVNNGRFDKESKQKILFDNANRIYRLGLKR